MKQVSNKTYVIVPIHQISFKCIRNLDIYIYIYRERERYIHVSYILYNMCDLHIYVNDLLIYVAKAELKISLS